MANIKKRAQIWLRKSTPQQREWIRNELGEAPSVRTQNPPFLYSEACPSVTDLVEFLSNIEDTPETQNWLTALQARWRNEKRNRKGGKRRVTVTLPTDVWGKIEEYRRIHKLNKSEAILEYMMESGLKADSEIEERILQVKEQQLDKLKAQVANQKKGIETLKGQLNTALQANDRLTSSYESLTYLLSEYKARFGKEGLETPLSKEEIEKQKSFYRQEINDLNQINSLRKLVKQKFTRF